MKKKYTLKKVHKNLISVGLGVIVVVSIGIATDGEAMASEVTTTKEKIEVTDKVLAKEKTIEIRENNNLNSQKKNVEVSEETISNSKKENSPKVRSRRSIQPVLSHETIGIESDITQWRKIQDNAKKEIEVKSNELKGKIEKNPGLDPTEVEISKSTVANIENNTKKEIDKIFNADKIEQEKQKGLLNFFKEDEKIGLAVFVKEQKSNIPKNYKNNDERKKLEKTITDNHQEIVEKIKNAMDKNSVRIIANEGKNSILDILNKANEIQKNNHKKDLVQQLEQIKKETISQIKQEYDKQSKKVDEISEATEREKELTKKTLSDTLKNAEQEINRLDEKNEIEIKEKEYKLVLQEAVSNLETYVKNKDNLERDRQEEIRKTELAEAKIELIIKLGKELNNQEKKVDNINNATNEEINLAREELSNVFENSRTEIEKLATKEEVQQSEGAFVKKDRKSVV